MSYLVIKHAHMALALATIILFVGRGVFRLRTNSNVVGRVQKNLNYLSYGVDIGLFALGLYLLSVWGGSGAPMGWVAGKLIFLVCYIVLGVIAFRPLLSRQYRWLCFGAAIVFWVLMYKTARLKLPFWQWFG